jgi:hypothetical protein
MVTSLITLTTFLPREYVIEMEIIRIFGTTTFLSHLAMQQAKPTSRASWLGMHGTHGPFGPFVYNVFWSHFELR